MPKPCRRDRWLLAAAVAGWLAACGTGATAKAGTELGPDPQDTYAQDSYAIDALDAADAPWDASAAVSDASDLPDSVTLADAATAMAADVTELSDVAVDSAGADAATDVAVEAGPQACFYGSPPAADAWVADVVPPAAPCAAVAAPDWFEGQPTPKPTLDLQVGWRDKSGTWHPYQDGDWVPLLTANQGGFHVELVPVIVLPGQTAASVPLQLQSFTLYDCDQIGNAATAMSAFVQTTGPDGEYTLDPAKQVFTIFGTGIGNIDQYCGIWIHVFWRVRIKDTNQWGQAVRLLRTYNATPPPSKG